MLRLLRFVNSNQTFSSDFQAHEERCWSLTRLDQFDEKDQSMVTCGADGQIVVWSDISEEIWEEGTFSS